MKRILATLVAGASVAVLVCGCGAAHAAGGSPSIPATDLANSPSIPATDLAKLSSMLHTEASAMGDSDPTGLVAAKTDLSTALAATNGGEDNTRDPGLAVYVLVAHGSFSGEAGPVPAGQSPSPGDTITMTVDAATFATVGVSMTDAEVDTDSLGTVVPLP